MAEVSAQSSWTRLKDLYFAASELTGSRRQLFIDQNCPPGDPLREQLVRLLREADRSDGVLDVPVHTPVLPPAVSSLPPGACLNHYKILDLVARGGLGVVYRATDVRLKRTVAIKVLRWETIRDGGRERFIREAEIAASLTHPNIIAIYDIGTADGVDYIAMEYAAGRTLRQLISAGPIELVTVLTIARQIADALAALHRVGIIHRDVKPTNVVVTGSGLVKVLDFGLAKALFHRAVEGFELAPDQADLSKPGMIIGTFAYMSPEQAEGKSADARSDIFSFGALLYEMLTGCAPFTAKTDLGVLSAVMNASPRAIHEIAPHVPPDVERLVFECLHKDPAARWQRMADVKVALDHLLASASSSQARPAVVATRLRERPSIAVLPFANMSAAEDTEYFADGLTEELINALSRLEGLRVVSRTSAFEFKGKAMNIRRVGGQLGVSTVLEGSVRKSGNRLRITAQLAKVTDGYQLWAARFDRQMTDVFEIQDEIAQTIARTLEIALKERDGEPLVKRYTTDLEAYHLYLRGRFHWNKRTAAGFEKAREYFEGALERDPQFAPAHAGLADYHVSVASWGLAPPEIAWPQAKSAAMKAIGIDPALADAHIALAAYRTYYEWNWAEGEREFRLARQLNPMDANVCTQFGTYLIQRGRFDDASAEIRRAADIDPLSPTVNTCLAGVAYYSRDYDRAVKICRQALDIAPDDIELAGVLGMSYEAKGCLDDALTAYRSACSLSQDHPMLLALLAGATAKAGRQDDAKTLVERLEFLSKEGYVPPIAWGWVHTALGDFDAAFNWLEKAADAHDVMLAYLVVGPCYDPLRLHPRFPYLLERIGARATDDLESPERTAAAEATRRMNRV